MGQLEGMNVMNTDPVMNRFRSGRSRGAFTLIELIVVMTIISIMLTMAGFALRGTLESQRLSTSATRLAGDLASVGLKAVKENRTLEIRFLLEESDFKNDPRYRSYQVWAIDPLTGTAAAVTEKLKFDNGIVCLQDATRSNLLQHETPSSVSAGKVYGYALLANGSTDLSKGTSDRWCLTLVSERMLAKLPSGKLPADYRTLVINSHTGAVKVY